MHCPFPLLQNHLFCGVNFEPQEAPALLLGRTEKAGFVVVEVAGDFGVVAKDQAWEYPPATQIIACAKQKPDNDRVKSAGGRIRIRLPPAHHPQPTRPQLCAKSTTSKDSTRAR
ncbi:hypothetical protein J2I47_14945 [Fibrella sp. HMF5335]|uniref:Uncharacterized protein n=1 Tax=Fibrella rubiginis TaxID=2817060 RepID=A0A939K3Y1_9BACT|nr:hypothetical protein [Fibrella rubiginis]MBO0937854.1 hypothetical protein [Fibrella rubiginis]